MRRIRSLTAGYRSLIGVKKTGMRGVFCPQPWEYFTIDSSGNVYACKCGSLWSNKRIGNLLTQEPLEIWNSKSAQAIRKSILDSSYRFCKASCPKLQYKQFSSSQNHNTASPQDVIANKLPVVNEGPRFLNLGYDMSCNLYCRSCRKEKVFLEGEGLAQAAAVQNKILDEEFLKGVAVMQAGLCGEPLASSLNTKLFRDVDLSRFSRLRVRLVTNGLFFTPSMWQSFQKNHACLKSIYVSVDAATAKTYTLLRRGGDFNTVMENLSFISRLRRNNCLEDFSIGFVVQKENYREMRDFILLGERLSCDTINFTHLQDYGTYARQEYNDAAVHRTLHPENRRLREYLTDPLFGGPAVKITQALLRGEQ